MNRKGFTLVELLATIVILALVISIGSYSIATIVKNSKQKNYDLLIKHVKDATEVYYQECKYANNSGIDCRDDSIVSLGDLVKYGYLKGNSQKDDSSYTIINPLDDKNIETCQIKVVYTDGHINVTAITTDGSCPTEY